MHFLVTGGTGFIGARFVFDAINKGHKVTVLSRNHKASHDSIQYIKHLDLIQDDSRIDAIINLAGASLGERRWTKKYKAEILQSRLEITENLVKLCDRLFMPPSTILNASAIGYYGSRGDEVLDECSSSGESFSSGLCLNWEKLSLQMQSTETRVCLLRFGVVFDGEGGALTQLSQSFRFKIGTQIGSGKQWISWVHLEDVLRAIIFLLEREELEGAFNVTSPNPVRVSELCELISQELPVMFTFAIPGVVTRLMLGEMATELLLSSQRVSPSALTNAGFDFLYGDLNVALKRCFETS